MEIQQNNEDTIYSITRKVYTQIVKEEDEYTMSIIKDYIKSKENSGEFIAAKFIPEGQLRHIINLGLTIYNKEINGNLLETELFQQEEYIEFLRNQNKQLRDKLNSLQEISEDTKC